MEDAENDLSNFWCHQCGKEIIPAPGPRCPDCQGDFIEEMAPPAAPLPPPPRPSSVPRAHGFSFRMGGNASQGPFFQVYQQPLYAAPSMHADVNADEANFPFPLPFMPFFGAPRAPPSSAQRDNQNAVPMELQALQKYAPHFERDSRCDQRRPRRANSSRSFITELLGVSGPFVHPNEAGFGGGGSWENLLNQLFEQGSGYAFPLHLCLRCASMLTRSLQSPRLAARVEGGDRVAADGDHRPRGRGAEGGVRHLQGPVRAQRERAAAAVPPPVPQAVHLALARLAQLLPRLSLRAADRRRRLRGQAPALREQHSTRALGISSGAGITLAVRCVDVTRTAVRAQASIANTP